MESITAAAEEILIDSLSFTLPGSGQYIQERRSVSFQTEGSNTYAPDAGTRVMRFKLATEGWLDPSTVRIFLDVINNDQSATGQAAPWPAAKVLRPLGPVHAFFRRLRITMRGVVIEDIMDYNRVQEMFEICTPSANRVNTRAEGFGYNWENEKLASPENIPGFGTMQTVCFKPLCGILMQTKFIPLRYCPLEIELELADMDDPIISSGEGIPNAGVKTAFEATISQKWKLQGCQLKADMITLDNQLDNSYVNHLLNRRPLNLVYNTFISNIQTITSPDTLINVSRSLSRLKSVFLSLERNLAGQRIKWWTKNWNTYYSPMAIDTMKTTTTHVQANEITSLQLQIGSFVIPQYPIRSHAECFYSLRKALGLASNNYVSLDIDGNDYRNNKFIVGVDCEKILGLAFTGTNTNNSLMTVRMKTEQANQADRFHILLTAEMVLEIHDGGITVFD
jgi:hypothetical protein